MRFPSLSLSLLLLASLFLVGCGNGKKATTLEVTHGFVTANVDFNGGLMVYGESSTGKKVALSIINGKEKTVELDGDTWTFYAIGWVGSDKFSGIKYCGMVTQDLTKSSAVGISVTTAACADTNFIATVGLNDTRVLACATFNKYDINTDSWSPLTATDTDLECSANPPLGFQPTLAAYKLVASDVINGIKTPIFESACYPTLGTNSLFIPTNKFPFEMKAYRTDAECNSANGPFQSFNFINGLSVAAPLEFDHIAQTYGTPVKTRIVIPTSISRRGNSPFINMVPRILCGSSASTKTDCLTDVTDAVHVSVPWSNSSQDRQVLAKNVPDNACSTLPLSTSKFFGLTECAVSDGVMRGRVHRNSFVCQGTGTMYGVKDFYFVSGKMLVLRSSTNDNIEVYTDSGKLLQTITLSGTSFNSVAGIVEASSGNILIYAYNGSNKQIYKFSINSSLVISDLGTNSYFSSLDPINDIEVLGDENIMFATSSGIIGRRNWATGVNGFTDFTSPNVGVTIPKIIYKNSKLYFIQNGIIYKYSYDVTSGNYGALTNLPLSGLTNITLSNAQNYIYAHAGNFIKTYDTAMLTAVSGGEFDVTISGQSSLISNADKIYIANPTSFTSLSQPAIAISNITNATNACSETNVYVAGKNLNISAKLNDQFSLFRDAINLVGKRSFTTTEYVSYLFDDINKDGENSGGGKLRRVQESLGIGVSSLLGSKFSTCADVVTTATANPISLTRTITDPFEGKNFVVNVQVTRSTTVIPDWICVDNNAAATACASVYDLDVSYTVLKGGINAEKGLLKVKCNSKLGSFEAYEFDSAAKWSRDFIAYNTGDHASSRFESYQLDKDSATSTSGEITKLLKTGPQNFSSRTINAGFNNSKPYASARELERTASNFYSKGINISPSSWADLFANSGFLSDRANDSFSAANAPSCSLATDTSIYANNVATCYFTSLQIPHTEVRSSTNASLVLRIDDLHDLDVPLSSILKTYFTLNP
jgi:hypothetical protein